MQADRFTTKSQEALSAALSLAAARRHSEAAPEHLLAALLEPGDGFVPRVLRKLGARPEAVRADVDAALGALPTLSAPEEPRTSRGLLTVLRGAESEMSALRDEYISVEHLLLALTQVPGRAGDTLRANGIGHDT